MIAALQFIPSTILCGFKVLRKLLQIMQSDILQISRVQDECLDAIMPRKGRRKKTAGHTSPIIIFPARQRLCFFTPSSRTSRPSKMEMSPEVPHQNRANKENNPGQLSPYNHLAGRSPAKCFEKKKWENLWKFAVRLTTFGDLRKYNMFQEASKCHALFAIV